MSNTVYDWIKRFAQVILPALNTLYFALSEIWNLPAPSKIFGTIAAINVFLGTVIVISARSYVPPEPKIDNVMEIFDNEDGGTNLRIKRIDPDILLESDTITFKIQRE